MKPLNYAFLILLSVLLSCDGIDYGLGDADPCTQTEEINQGHEFPMSEGDLDWRDYFEFTYEDLGGQISLGIVYTGAYAPYACVDPYKVTFKARVTFLNNFETMIENDFTRISLTPGYGYCQGEGEYYTREMDWVYPMSRVNNRNFYESGEGNHLVPANNCREADPKNTFYAIIKLNFIIDVETWVNFIKSEKNFVNSVIKEIEVDFTYTR